MKSRFTISVLVTVTDGVQTVRSLSFFTVAHGKVPHLAEHWPEPYSAPANRTHLAEPLH